MAAPMLRLKFLNFHRLSANFVTNLSSRSQPINCRIRTLSTTSSKRGDIDEVASKPQDQDGGKEISAAMRSYLERVQKHDAFMAEQITDYEIGKRHLANIMGKDADNFSQEEIDQAIEYLLPSGLFDKKARPILKHPEILFPKKKAAQFAADGRPFHPFFYTGMPNYYMIMHEAAVKYEDLKLYEAQMRAKGTFNADDQTCKIIAASSEWISIEELKARTLEKVDEHCYNRFLILFDRILHHPYGVREKEFLMQYRKPLVKVGLTDEIPPLIEAENGRKYSEAKGKRKTANAEVRLWSDGTGKVTINGRGLVDHFPDIMDREQIAFPLQFTNQLMKLDVEATVESGGPSGQAGAIRLALSRALMSFVDKDMVERLRLAGLLTKDPRRKERKKPGQWKARKKFTWKKR